MQLEEAHCLTVLTSLVADLKPDNVLLNMKGEVKLCDLGQGGELINSLVDSFVGRKHVSLGRGRRA